MLDNATNDSTNKERSDGKTYRGLSEFDFLMEYGYLPQHKGVIADQDAPATIAEADPEGYAAWLASLEEDEGDECQEGEEVGRTVTSNTVTSLADVAFSDVVLKTHERVEKIIFDQYYRKDGMKFLSEWTGRGKTTGIIKALGELFVRHPEAKVLLVTREMAEVDNLWRTVMATLPEVHCLGWSGVHKGQTTVEEWEPVRNDVKKAELSEAQLIITTHKAGTDKKNGYLHKDRDLLLIDEYPDPVDEGGLGLTDLAALLEETKFSHRATDDVVKRAMKWARDLYEKRPIKDDSWIDVNRAEFAGG